MVNQSACIQQIGDVNPASNLHICTCLSFDSHLCMTMMFCHFRPCYIPPLLHSHKLKSPFLHWVQNLLTYEIRFLSQLFVPFFQRQLSVDCKVVATLCDFSTASLSIKFSVYPSLSWSLHVLTRHWFCLNTMKEKANWM